MGHTFDRDDITRSDSPSAPPPAKRKRTTSKPPIKLSEGNTGLGFPFPLGPGGPANAKPESTPKRGAA